MWKDLTMSQRAEVIKMAVKAGYRDVDSIRSFYDNSVKYAEGGGLDDDPPTASDVRELAIGMVPIVGAGYDIYQAYKDPSLANIGIATASTLLDVANLFSGGTASIGVSALKGALRGGVKSAVKQQVVKKATPKIAERIAASRGTRVTSSIRRAANREASKNARSILMKDLKEDAWQQGLFNAGQMFIQTENGRHFWEK